MKNMSVAGWFTPPQVIGLSPSAQADVGAMLTQWRDKLPRNLTRKLYLDGKNHLKDLRVSLPPGLVDELEIVMGWPEKAVFELADRITLERITDIEESADPFGMNGLLFDNRFDVEMPQATASSLAYSATFATTTPGDVSAGQPDVLVLFHSAMWATGIWDKATRSLRAGLLVTQVDPLGMPTAFTVFYPDSYIECVKGRSWYVADVIPHNLGRCPMELMPFRPMLDRPFGRARIDRRVMSLTDRAVRGGARLEVHSEMFGALKLILLGADESAFTDEAGNPVPLWTFYMGRMNALRRDEEGELPKIEKISAESPEPHIAVLHQLAAEFSGHTGVPLTALGVSSANPESADAKIVAREDNIKLAENQHKVYEFSLRRILENALRLREPGFSGNVLDLVFRWRSPDRPTLSALADAGTKQLSMLPEELRGTSVGMELVGLAPDQIARALNELQRSRGGSLLDRVLAAREAVNSDDAA